MGSPVKLARVAGRLANELPVMNPLACPTTVSQRAGPCSVHFCATVNVVITVSPSDQMMEGKEEKKRLATQIISVKLL